MIKLSPSILSANFANLLADIKSLEEAGVDLLHIDVMDGHFVPNITIGPPVINSIKKHTSIPFDIHLMIEDPDRYIDDFIKAGADILTVHVEACKHIHRTVQNIKSNNIKVGISLNPSTPLNVLEYILDDIDMVLIMSVNPGFGGQKFITNTLRKIKDLKKMIDNRGLNIDIEVDGGVKIENVNEIIKAGANIIVAGSAIFNSESIADAVKEFKNQFKLI